MLTSVLADCADDAGAGRNRLHPPCYGFGLDQNDFLMFNSDFQGKQTHETQWSTFVGRLNREAEACCCDPICPRPDFFDLCPATHLHIEMR